MSVYKKLIEVQNELKAPKSQYNNFGKYAYRNAEDILEALKPVLHKVGATVFIKDKIQLIGERFYVEATAVFIDIESSAYIEASALARESEEKKGMDSAQVTGATSSYARKYALNGLFLIDDTKDNDHDSNYQTDLKKEELEKKKAEKNKADDLVAKGKVILEINDLIEKSLKENEDLIEKQNKLIVTLNKAYATNHKGLNDFTTEQLMTYLKSKKK